MHSDLTIAIIAGLGGMLGWGFADFFAKKTIDRIGDLTTLFWSQVLGIIPLLIIFLANPYKPEFEPRDPLYLLFFGALSALSYLPVYKGFGKGQVSLLSPIFASYGALVVIMSALFFGESIPEARQLAIVIVYAGIIAISVAPRDLTKLIKRRKLNTRGVPEILLATGMYAVELVLLDSFISGKKWVLYLLGIRIFSALTLLVLAFITRHPLRIKDQNLWKYLALIGVFDVLAYSFVAYGFSATELTSVVALLSSIFSLPTIILAHFFLKEKITELQTLAAITILTGVSLIAVT